MATTVIAAFNEFQREAVNLDADDSALAKRSRNWLFDRIGELPGKYDDFPSLYDEKRVSYGSFSRRTKIRPLDDIDMISCLHASGATYTAYSHDDVRIAVPDASRLSNYRHTGSDNLNSARVINRYVGALSSVAQYRKAEVNRRGEAATLQLSYDWNFDIVPAFFTSPESDGRTYYLIPNGAGHWKKTDPRIDRDRVTNINRRHDGNMLNIIRCVKHWQKRRTMPTMSSYLLESIVVAHFEAKQDTAAQYVDLELADVFRGIATAVLDQVPDPKGIQVDINDLDWSDRISISVRALQDASKVDEARLLESTKDMQSSINRWRAIFGDDFPEYG